MRTLVFRLLTVFLAFTLVFFLLRMLPGDYFVSQIAQGTLSPELAQRYREQLGLDQPLVIQYLQNIRQFIAGDPGISFARLVPVSLLLSGALQFTFSLAIASLGLAVLIGVGLGILAARPRGLVSRFTGLLIAVIQGMPVYWTATLLMIAAGLLISFDPQTQRSVYETQLPVLALGLSSAGGIARVTQSALRQVAHLDAIRTARAKGLSERRIFFRHVFRLALPPILTAIGLQAGFLLSGTVIIEIIFARPGIGRILYDAVLSRDYPVVQTVVVLSSVVYITINLMLDLVQIWIDPRVSEYP